MTDIQLKKALFRLPNGTYVTPYTDCKGAFEIGDIGQALHIDESLGLRRILNGQTVAIDSNTTEFLNKLKSIRTSYPNLFCDEEEYSDIVRNNGLGQCGKFVIQETTTSTERAYNIVVIGDVKYAKGVYSDFLNKYRYVKPNKTIELSTFTSWELMLKIRCDQLGVENTIIGNATDSGVSGGFVLQTDTDNNIKIWSTNDMSSWNVLSASDTGIDLALGWQYLKLVWDGIAYTLSTSTDKENWTVGTSLTAGAFSNVDMWIGANGSPINTTNANGVTHFLRGAIDIKECYMSTNSDSNYWIGCTETQTTVTPYIRLPKVVESVGTLNYATLGDLTTNPARKLVAQKKPTVADTTWYNWYSDGWLEQGGRYLQNYTIQAAWEWKNTILPKPYRDPFYNVSTATGHHDYTHAPTIRYQDPERFESYPYNNTGNAQWFTKGWAKIPTELDINTSEKVGEPTYPYFIQIAQGQYTMRTIRNDWEINNPYTIFDAKQSQYPLNNTSWLKSLGQWNEKAVYTYAYEALLVELNNSIETNTTVDLPSGGKYTKHLQTVNFNVNKVVKIGNPVIEEGILTPTDTDYVQLKVGENILNTAKSWQLDLLCQISSNYIVATDYDNSYVPFAINNSNLIINNSLNTFSTIAEGWKYLRVKFNDSTGYEVYTSDDGNTFDLITSIETVDKVDYADNNLNLKGTPVDLRTVQFKYDLGDGVEHLVTTGVEYKSAVWNKAEHTTSEADYAYNFIVDTVNESFRLPLYDRVFNNPYAELYYYIGDTLQNTSLIDIGRLSESITVNKSEIEQLRTLISQIAGDIPTIETSTHGFRNVTIYNGTDLGDHVIDLSSYIPLDGHEYDVYGYIYWAVGDTSGNDRNAYIYDAAGANKLYQLSVDGVVSPNAGNCTDTWQVPLPANSRTITLRLTGTSNSKFSKFQLILLWFRKY